MIKKLLSYKLSKKDMKEIKQATKNFRNSIICGAAYSATMYCINQIVGKEKPTEFSTFLLDSINFGIDLSVNSYVDSVLATILKPEIHNFWQWVPWGFGTSIVTTLAMQAIRTPIRNYYITGKVSMNQYFDKLLQQTVHDSFVHVSLGAASIYLPPAPKMGGEFARSLAAITIGHLGGTIANTPFYVINDGIPIKSILVSFWNGIPYSMIDHTIFLIINHNFDKLAYSRYLSI